MITVRGACQTGPLHSVTGGVDAVDKPLPREVKFPLQNKRATLPHFDWIMKVGSSVLFQNFKHHVEFSL